MSTMLVVKVLKGTLLEKTLLSKLIIVLWICRGHIIKGLPTNGSLIQDVEDLYAACPNDYSCPEFRHGDSLDVSNVACSCSRQCSQFGTCCVNSPYRYPLPRELTQTCRTVQSFPRSGNYFMIDRCPSGNSVSTEWDSLCKDEWNGDNDIMKLVPVTSVFTGITYKNYFCFRCYETANHFFYWKIRPHIAPNSYYNEVDYDPTLSAEGESSTRRQVKLAYDGVRQTWIALSGKDSIPIPVALKFEIPKEIEPLRVECDPGVISNCSDKYYFDDASNKCHSYTAAIYVRKNDKIFKYKNAHCALCNFEDLNDMICESHFLANTDGIPGRYSSFEDKRRKDPGSAGPWADDGSGSGENVGYKNPGRAGKELRTDSEKKYFKLNLLIDISSDDITDSKCEGNSVWDPYAGMCRKLLCGLPGYVMKGGKCSRP